MKRLIIITIAVSLIGCRGLKRLTSGSEIPPPVVNRIEPQIPNFNLPNIVGYDRIQYQGWMDSGYILLKPNNVLISLWVWQGNGWIKCKVPNIQISYDSVSGILSYTNFLPNTYYVIYQWVLN